VDYRAGTVILESRFDHFCSIQGCILKRFPFGRRMPRPNAFDATTPRFASKIELTIDFLRQNRL
jgi:hypothetical protein